MNYADASIKVLQSVGAQGMITWDPEGEQYAASVYYGAPQLTSTLAPETDFAPPGQMATMDEYFAKFRAAGLRTGVAIRPQHIVFGSNAVPTQETVADTLPELLAKVQYASQRWGCTIFYIDLTVTASGTPISADVFESLHKSYPNFLFIPEEKNYRDYAYVAPLNSFSDFGITGTPAPEYDVYPQAFSSIFIHNSEQGQLTASQAALTASANHGDLFIFTSWYQNEQSAFLQQLYQPTPPVPTATPGLGVYTSAQQVTLTATSSLSIHYSTTTTAPTCSSGTTYTSPITISGATTLQAIACYANGASNVASISYLFGN